MADTALLASLIFRSSSGPINDSIYTSLLTDKISLNLGFVMENASEALRSLYFYIFDHYEIDFLILNGKKLIPVEVKSSSYSSQKSLDLFCEKYSDRVDDRRCVIYPEDVKKDGSTIFIPFYMAMCL